MYYLRTKAAADAIQFTVDQEALQKVERKKIIDEKAKKNMEAMVCSLENRDDCLACGS